MTWGREESTEKAAIPPGFLTGANVTTSVLSKRDRRRKGTGSRGCGDDKNDMGQDIQGGLQMLDRRQGNKFHPRASRRYEPCRWCSVDQQRCFWVSGLELYEGKSIQFAAPDEFTMTCLSWEQEQTNAVIQSQKESSGAPSLEKSVSTAAPARPS